MQINVNKVNKLNSYIRRTGDMAREMLMDKDYEINVLGQHMESIARDLEFQVHDLLNRHGPIVEVRKRG